MKKLTALFLALIFSSHSAIFAAEAIVDDFANKTLMDVKLAKYTPNVIVDDFAQSRLKNIKSVNLVEKEPIVDEFALETLQSYKNVPIPKGVITEIATNEISVFVSSSRSLTTQNDIYEGQKVDFIIAKDVVQNGKIVIPKGTQVTGRVELITMNGAFGTPADLTVGNFTLQNDKNLEGEIKITGANRSLWVYPVGYSTTVFFGLGALIFAVRGGHAKIKPDKEFELIYYPKNL